VPIDPTLSLIEWERAPAVQVRAKYEHYQEYLKLIPALRTKPVPIAIDEVGLLRWQSRLLQGCTCLRMGLPGDVPPLRCIPDGRIHVRDRNDKREPHRSRTHPPGMLFKMYRDHFGAIPVEVTGDSPQPKPTFPAGGDQPAVNPGSDTYPLDVSAAFSEDRKTLAIAVLNPSSSEQSIKLTIDGAKLASSGHLYRMAPDSIDATVQVDKKPEVQVEEQTLGPLLDTITVRPFSVNIYSYPVQ